MFMSHHLPVVTSLVVPRETFRAPAGYSILILSAGKFPRLQYSFVLTNIPIITEISFPIHAYATIRMVSAWFLHLNLFWSPFCFQVVMLNQLMF